MTELDAAGLIERLHELAQDGEREKIARRLPPGEDVIGLRMRDLFDTAKAWTALPLSELDVLFAHPTYEPRMAAFCILDFKARKKLDEAERRALYETYLAKHDRITAWDMVDRSAPRVVGGWLVGRDKQPLKELAASDDPLRRRTALTAPLMFNLNGTEQDVVDGLEIAASLAEDDDPIVSKPVGILLKHTSKRYPELVIAFLDANADRMPKVAVRMAREKL